MPRSVEGSDASAEVAQDIRWFRGGAAPWPQDRLGPSQRPEEHWAVDLGAVIIARPTLADVEGRMQAFVGTHAGRFAGVTLAGADAGSVGLDVSLGGMVWSSAAVGWDGRLYVGADDDRLYAIDPRAGVVDWSMRLGSCWPPRVMGPEGTRCDVDGGPTVGPAGDLYVGGAGSYRITTSGFVRWRYPSADLVRAAHVFSTPVVTDRGLVYYGAQDGVFRALTRDGALVWRHQVGPDVDGSPAVATDGSVYVGADDGKVYALDASGRLRWTFSTRDDIRSAIAIGPSGALYVTSLDGTLYSLGPDGTVRWTFPTEGPIASSPVVDPAGNVFFGSRDEYLYAVSSAGRLLWKVPLPADIDGSVAIGPSQTLVVGCDDGLLRAFGKPLRP